MPDIEGTIMFCPVCNGIMALAEDRRPEFVCGNCLKRLSVIDTDEMTDYEDWCGLM